MPGVRTPAAPRTVTAEPDPLVRWTLRLESFAAFVAGLALYLAAGGGWFLLLPALLLPDVGMVGYLVSPRVGAVTYNLVHDYAVGIALVLVGWWAPSSLLVSVGGILIAHVGMDRTMGYGLKYPTGFGDTHLGPIGRRTQRSISSNVA
ncbi:MAG: hypothetical protein QOH61_2069 [Chloroflexota bacterium]|jgi:hypothetical protein|nr:hypothetical protein [Chloroflexota bacterium]